MYPVFVHLKLGLIFGVNQQGSTTTVANYFNDERLMISRWKDIRAFGHHSDCSIDDKNIALEM